MKKGLLHATCSNPFFFYRLIKLMNTIKIPELQKSMNMAPTKGTAKNARGAGP